MFSSPAPFGTQQQSVSGQNNSLFAPKPFGSPATPFNSQTAGMFSSNSTGNFGGGTQAFSSPAFFGSQTGGMFSSNSTGNFGGGNQAFSSPPFGIPASAPVSSVASFGTPTFTPAFSTSSFAGTSIFSQKPASNANTPGFGPPTTPAFSTPTTPAGFGQPNSGFGNKPFSSTPSPFGTQSSSFSFQTTTPSTSETQGTFGQPGLGQQKRGASRAVAYAPIVLEDSALGTGKVKVHSISFMHVYAEKSHEELKWEDYQLGDKGGPIPAATPQQPKLFWSTPQPNTFTTTTTTPNPFSFRIGSSTPVFKPTIPFDCGTIPSTTPAVTAPPFNFGTTSSTTPAFTAPPFNFGTTCSSTPSSATSPFSSTPGTANNFGLTIGVPPKFQQTNNGLGQFPSSVLAPVSTTSSCAPLTNTVGSQNSGFWNSSLNPTPGTTNNFGLTIGVPPAFQQTKNALGQFPSSPFAPVSTTSAPLTSTVGTQNSGFWNSSLNPTPGTTNNFGLTIGVPPAFQQTNNALGQVSSSPFAPVSTTSSCAPLTNTVVTQNSGFWNNPFNSTPSQLSWSNTVNGQTNQSPQTQPAFSFLYSGQQQQPAVGGYNVSTGIGVASSGFNSLPNSFGQNTFPQPSTQPSGVAMNPFGTLPAMPQISIGHTRAAPSIQYGISKTPVVDKPAPVRVSSLLTTSRHLSQRRVRLPARSSCPDNCARVPFFM